MNKEVSNDPVCTKDAYSIQSNWSVTNEESNLFINGNGINMPTVYDLLAADIIEGRNVEC